MDGADVNCYADMSADCREFHQPLRANIDETILLVVITEQGENRNQCEGQWNLSGFPHGVACHGT